MDHNQSYLSTRQLTNVYKIAKLINKLIVWGECDYISFLLLSYWLPQSRLKTMEICCLRVLEVRGSKWVFNQAKGMIIKWVPFHSGGSKGEFMTVLLQVVGGTHPTTILAIVDQDSHSLAAVSWRLVPASRDHALTLPQALFLLPQTQQQQTTFLSCFKTCLFLGTSLHLSLTL